MLHFAPHPQLQAVICLVNPAHVGSLEGLYLDQVNIADVVVASKVVFGLPSSV
jgi:G3E family GTPase